VRQSFRAEIVPYRGGSTDLVRASDAPPPPPRRRIPVERDGREQGPPPAAS
jgi:hypothetical protein